MPPSGFERLCQRLPHDSGFIDVEVTGRSGDGGIDWHGIIRAGGLTSFPVLISANGIEITLVQVPCAIFGALWLLKLTRDY